MHGHPCLQSSCVPAWTTQFPEQQDSWGCQLLTSMSAEPGGSALFLGAGELAGSQLGAQASSENVSLPREAVGGLEIHCRSVASGEGADESEQKLLCHRLQHLECPRDTAVSHGWGHSCPFGNSCYAVAFTSAGPLKSQASLTSTRFPRAVYCLYLRPFHQPRQASSVHSTSETSTRWCPQAQGDHGAPCSCWASGAPQSPTVCSEGGERTFQAPGIPGDVQRRTASCPAPHCVCAESCSAAWQDTVRLSRTPHITAHTARDTLGTVPGEVTARCRALSVPGVPWCSHQPPALYRTLQRGRQKGARKGQVVLGMVLSSDVLDAGVQEHVLVLQERKGGQVSDRDLLVTD